MYQILHIVLFWYEVILDVWEILGLNLAPRAFTNGFIIVLSSSHKYSYSTLKQATTEILPNSLCVFILPHNTK